MSGKRKFVDVAKEAMGRSSLSKGIGYSDVRIVLEHVAKHSQRRVQFEWKKMKGRAMNSILKRMRSCNTEAPKEKERKKRGGNPAFGERKKRQKARAFTAIKNGIIKLCRDNDMYQLLQECVSRASFIACEFGHYLVSAVVLKRKKFLFRK